MNEIEAVWFACALDCEGSIIFQPATRLRKGTTRLIIYNTNIPFLKKVADIAGVGKILTYPSRNLFPGRRVKSKRTNWYWQTNRRPECYAILKQILPYLIIKKDIAYQLILFHELRGKRNNQSYNEAEWTILKGEYTNALKGEI